MPDILLGDLAEVVERVPTGRYVARLNSVDTRESKSENKNPMIVPEFEIVEGEHEGESVQVFHVLTVTQGKNGKPYSRGITDIKKTFNAIGAPIPLTTRIPYGSLENAQKVAELYHKKLKGKKVTLLVTEDKSKGGEKTYTRAQVIGLAEKSVGSTETLEGLEDIA